MTEHNMSGPSKELDEIGAGSSGMLASSEMEGEDEYYNPDGTEWSQKAGLLCRICANPNEYLIPIFDGEGLEHELGTKIQKHLPIKVTETDTLPIHVCYQCASTLIAWHDLVNCCVEADKKLRELQMVEDDEDDDDKGAEMFESHSFDSEMVAEDDGPSTSELQNQAPEIKSPKKLTVDKKSKLKMVLVKGSAAGTSGQKIVPKIQVAKVELGKPKEGTSQDSASERCQLFSTYQQARYTTGNWMTLSQWSEWYNADGVSEYYDDKDGIDVKFSVNDTALYYGQDGKYKYSSQTQEESDEQSMHDKYNSQMQEEPDERPIYECHHCGKKLASRENIKVHLRIHSGERPFTCHVCGKRFLAQSGIKRHLKEVHEGVKEHVCDICGRAFANKRTLEDHRRIHTGERPFVCDMCGKTFKTKASLYVHNRSHTDVFPFGCPHCNRHFRTQTTLSLHVLQHTGEKPHECDICGRSFRIKYELRNHKVIHTGKKPVDCILCGQSFRLKRYLRRHIKAHHKN